MNSIHTIFCTKHVLWLMKNLCSFDTVYCNLNILNCKEKKKSLSIDCNTFEFFSVTLYKEPFTNLHKNFQETSLYDTYLEY